MRISKAALDGCVAVLALSISPSAQTNELISVDSAGLQGNFLSADATMSDDGRFVAFESFATNWGGTAYGTTNVYVRDRWNGVTERISVTPAGAAGNGSSGYARMTPDGRYVVFWSSSSDLVPGDVNGFGDCFVRDLWSDVTELVSVSSSGAQGDGGGLAFNAISADGRCITFASSATNLAPLVPAGSRQIFLRDRQAGTTECVSVDPNGLPSDTWAQGSSALSGDGRFVLFDSDATDLVAGDTNGRADVFLRDRANGVTVRVNLGSGGVQANDGSSVAWMSRDGRFVQYGSRATNLVPGDTNGKSDVFLLDRALGVTERVSLAFDGAQSNDHSVGSAMSQDGRYAYFASFASNLIPFDANPQMDAFVRDRLLATTRRISVGFEGQPPDNQSHSPQPSADGSLVLFQSGSSNLLGVPDINGNVFDVFVCTPGPCASIVTYCEAKPNSAGCTPAINTRGLPSASAGPGFLVGAEQVLPDKVGLLFYGTTGARGLPFQGGTMCVAPPRTRTPLRASSSDGAPPCTGRFAMDFNAWIASGADPALVAGRGVWVQYWYRDQAASYGAGLTDAVRFYICE